MDNYKPNWLTASMIAALALGSVYIVDIFSQSTKNSSEVDKHQTVMAPADNNPVLPHLAPKPGKPESTNFNQDTHSNTLTVEQTETELDLTKQETHFLWVKSIALPGTTAVQKKAFEIPEGWRVVSTNILRKKGRARILQQDNFVILEVHATSRDTFTRQDAFANAEIIIAKAMEE